MKRLFRKYIQSVLSPKEFDEFCDYIMQNKNTGPVFGLMKEEWTSQLEDDGINLKNPLLFQKIRHAILQEQAEKSSGKLKLYAIGLRIAAVLLIGMFAASILFYQQKASVLDRFPIQTVSIPYGATTQFKLPDGSSVWLNSGSSLSYSGNFSTKRKVELKGEAFFDVVKNAGPFIVQTNYGKVEVLGTAFNIQAYDDGDFTTTLERGMVKILDTANKHDMILNPGEQAKLINNKLVKNEVDTKLFTSWKDGKLIFSRDPFPDIMRNLERWFNVTIDYSANDFEGLWFSGTIESETLTEVMNMICKAAPVKYTYESAKREVKIESQ